MSVRNTVISEPSRVALTQAQARVIDAALEVFARQGVGGTSLQMIATEIGVTKAAVYHQYQTKEEIVLAVGEAELARLDAVVANAEAASSRKRAREALIAGMVDLAIERGPKVSTLLNDPVIGRLFAHHQVFADVMARMRRILAGEDTAPEAEVRTTMLIAAISGSATHPFVAHLDPDVLRAELIRLARRLLELPG